MRTGSYKPDTIPEHGDKRWGLSLVLRLEAELREALEAELLMLTKLRCASHLVYAAHDLHATVRSVEGFQDEVPVAQVEHYADQLRRTARGLPPIQVEYIGLSGSSSGVFVCGYPSPSLGELRRRLHDDQKEVGPLGVPGADADFVRDTAHVSLMVFRPPRTPEAELADYVSSRFDTHFGTAVVRALSLVRYRPTMESVHLSELARIPL